MGLSTQRLRLSDDLAFLLVAACFRSSVSARGTWVEIERNARNLRDISSYNLTLPQGGDEGEDLYVVAVVTETDKRREASRQRQINTAAAILAGRDGSDISLPDDLIKRLAARRGRRIAEKSGDGFPVNTSRHIGGRRLRPDGTFED